MQRPATRRRATRAALGTTAALVSAWLVFVAAPGWAHVEIDPRTATQGEDAALSVRVPNEADAASTTKVQVFLPQDHPLASVSVRPLAGWHSAVVTRKLDSPLSTDDGEVTEAAYRITWTPDTPQDAIQPGEYEDFEIAVGPLPEVSSLTFKTLQSYSDGSVVRWIDPPATEGRPEPEHPAPTLTLVPAAGHDSADAGAVGSDATDDGDGTATLALILSIVAVLLTAGAWGTSLLRRRR